MKPVDLTPAIRKYSGLFVALTHNRRRVVGKGMTPDSALEEARKKGVKDPVLTKIPENSRSYLL